MVSNIFYFHPYMGKIPILTNIFQMGWNHQLDKIEHHQWLDFLGQILSVVFRRITLKHSVVLCWFVIIFNVNHLPSLKLTAKAPKNGWLEYYFPIGFQPIFRGYVSFREGKHSSFLRNLFGHFWRRMLLLARIQRLLVCLIIDSCSFALAKQYD